MIGIIVTSVALGAFGIVLYQHAEMAIRHRLNWGKKVIYNRRDAGYVIKLRYGGCKHYTFVDSFGEPSKTYFYERSSAEEACKEEFAKKYPRQTSFTRVA